MVFDEEISKTVHLSKVLDALIYDDSEPRIILNFLTEHISELKGIFNESFCWRKVFNYDFAIRCNYDESVLLFDIVRQLPLNESIYLCWQLLASYSKAGNNLKRFAKHVLDNTLNKCNRTTIVHPWSSHFYNIQDIDVSGVFEFMNANNLMMLPNKLKIDAFKSYMNLIDKSLFAMRMLQYDIYSNCDDSRKYLMLTNRSIKSIDLKLQILDVSDDINEKKEVLKNFPLMNIGIVSDKTYVQDIIFESESFEELMMNLLVKVQPSDMSFSGLILWLISNRPHSWLKKMYDSESELAASCINMGDILKAA